MDLIDQKLQNEKLSASIQLAVNLESLFKLYSYRIIDHPDFIAQVSEEVELRLPVLRKQLEKIEE